MLLTAMWFERFAPGRRGHLGAGIILRGIKEIRHKAAPSKPGTDDTGDLSAYHPKLFTFERHMRRCVCQHTRLHV